MSIEVKYQQVAGSVDEKLQTCDFKLKQYLKLVASLGIKVEYVYVLNNWFKKPNTRMYWVTYTALIAITNSMRFPCLG
jgi:hypothetical protein